jgi:putative mRNA 3-end processing factor
MPSDLLIPTDRGLYCPEGNFHIDPWQPVERAIITHAHSDHVVPGCGSYTCSTSCEPVLRSRLAAPEPSDPTAPPPTIKSLPFGDSLDLGHVRVSLHPAGHILGSAQIAVERASGYRWVVSGDYKPGPDRTCETFTPVPCDTFITESTFGLPLYRWPDERTIFATINDWWRANAAQGRTSIIFAYSLGKAQRVLSGLDPTIGPIASHGAVIRFNRIYREAGIRLPDAPYTDDEVTAQIRGRGLVLAPPSALGSPWIRRFASTEAGASTAFASGWMLVRGMRRRRAIDRGFVISDHADWPGLLSTIRATGAKRIGVTHGYIAPLVRWLNESGLDAFPVPTRYHGEEDEPPAAPADAAPTAEGSPDEPPGDAP